MLKQILDIPGSVAKQLNVKDYLKGLGLSILMLISLTLPDITTAANGHDFGQFNKPIQFLVFILAWFVQRWAKRN